MNWLPSPLFVHGIHGIVTLSEKIGEVIHSNDLEEATKLEKLLKLIDGLELFQGKMMDVIRKVEGGFNFGEATLEGLNQDAFNASVVTGIKVSKSTIQIRSGVMVMTLPSFSAIRFSFWK
jgi:DUF917 family protein